MELQTVCSKKCIRLTVFKAKEQFAIWGIYEQNLLEAYEKINFMITFLGCSAEDDYDSFIIWLYLYNSSNKISFTRAINIIMDIKNVRMEW